MRRFLRRLCGAAFAACTALVAAAHIGDTNTHFRGPAGPYTVQVIVRHPGVVPGLADITVRVEGDAQVTRVGVRPVKAQLGLESAPRPDIAQPVPGAERLWAAQLWFMERGAYSVHVDVDGQLGAATAVVPVRSIATETLAMPRTLGAVLILLGVLLVTGFITIVRAAAGESVLPPGTQPDARTRRRGRVAAGVACVILAVALLGGWRWWLAEDAAYRNYLFEPLEIEANVVADGDARGLEIVLVDAAWTGGRFTPIVPDHGKMMHAFLVREPALDVFAHVHPEPVARDSFRVALPPLPPGSYRVYADIVHESGFAQTLTGTFDVGGDVTRQATIPAPDTDDSWWSGPALGATSRTVELADGATIRLRTGDALTAGQAVELAFDVAGPGGVPAALEPYMGMMAHAAVRRDDGAVFVHLHPTGSISMAAQELLVARHLGGEEGGERLHHGEHGGHGGRRELGAVETVTMPYAFPRAGLYRVWVQVKREGRAQTAAFDVEVGAGS
jgi:hypothetical protein